MSENKISKAPPPITPLSGSLSPQKPAQFDTNVKGQPNWKHWRHVATIEIWQGLLLTMNIEPPGNGWLLDNTPSGKQTGNIPYEYLDSHSLTGEFIRRWRLVCNRLETLYASAGTPRKAELTNFLRLPLFAAWAVEFEWEGLPTELAALAKAATQAAPMVKTAPVLTPSGDDKPWLVANHSDPTPDYPWYTPARYFARQLVKNDSTLLVKKQLLAEKTATSLESVGIYKRGNKKKSLSSGTVLKSFVNVALN